MRGLATRFGGRSRPVAPSPTPPVRPADAKTPQRTCIYRGREAEGCQRELPVLECSPAEILGARGVNMTLKIDIRIDRPLRWLIFAGILLLILS